MSEGAVLDVATIAAPGRTLLLVIDVQVDFAAPHGAMGRLGLDLDAGTAAIGRIEALVAAARAARVAVCFSRVVTRPETDSANLRALHARTAPGADGLAICRAGTPGADHHRLHPAPGDLTVEKIRYSCFAGTDLEATLRARGIDTIVAAGLTTDCCVDSTVRDAFHRDFHVVVAADACADYEQRHHAAALDVLGRHFAAVVPSEALIAAWRAAAGG